MLYDGDCPLCMREVRSTLAWDPVEPCIFFLLLISVCENFYEEMLIEFAGCLMFFLLSGQYVKGEE